MLLNQSYVFKVSLSRDIWRKIQISPKSSLHTFHSAILDAFEFDNDHLYAFFMDNTAWSDNAYWSEHSDSSPKAKSKKLSSFEFKKGDKFLYLFDFGDEWHFTISFVELADGVETKKPIVLERKGEAPEQYPDCEEDFD